MDNENPPPLPPQETPPPIPPIPPASGKHRSTWALVAGAAGALVVVAVCAVFFVHVINTAEKMENNRKDTATFERAIKEANELRQQSLETEDLEKAAGAQRAARNRMEETVGKIASPQTRADMQALMALTKPLSDYSEAYVRQAADFFGPGDDWLQRRNVSRESLENARAQVGRLAEANTKLAGIHRDLLAEVARRIKQNDAAAGISIPFLKGAQEGLKKQEPLMAEIRGADARLYAKIDELLALLINESGRWLRDEANGTVLWETDELLAKHLAIASEMEKIAVEQANMQKRLISLMNQ